MGPRASSRSHQSRRRSKLDLPARHRTCSSCLQIPLIRSMNIAVLKSTLSQIGRFIWPLSPWLTSSTPLLAGIPHPAEQRELSPLGFRRRGLRTCTRTIDKERLFDHPCSSPPSRTLDPARFILCKRNEQRRRLGKQGEELPTTFDDHLTLLRYGLVRRDEIDRFAGRRRTRFC